MLKIFTVFSLLLIVKCERRDKLKDLLSKKEPEPKDLENTQPIHIIKNEKACSGIRV